MHVLVQYFMEPVPAKYYKLASTCGNSKACLAANQEACCPPLQHTCMWRKQHAQNVLKTLNTLINMNEVTNYLLV